ncbi:MAG: DUF1499 domain-containing protein [Cyanobacteria bacterium]|nr:DUF1499 domain-containing protein [Cyanobacteria bacterium CG_2015-16_32_12]NCO76986.1 DUF1499 domain-containing protein [Cyanobacteria bacterium CG_2015-22_32_23]NCQ03672.1 DUF1499 domain-containing protein [Cyanobacteria bacterium CG_2015-09_32_10]NCS85179.1 DUF1499 domain-containing protein [Cyanobacteria bacterium CG_2015-02_32_10]
MLSIITIFSVFILSFSTLISPLYIFFSHSFPPMASVFHIEGKIPTNLGVKDGKLSPCPVTPNCVVSENADSTHSILPLSYEGDRNEAYNNFLKILSVVPETKIIEQKEDYIRTEFRSKIMGFVDDGEFYFPSDKNVIEWRSSSRLGESDLGVNRRRLEQIRLAFEDFNQK